MQKATHHPRALRKGGERDAWTRQASWNGEQRGRRSLRHAALRADVEQIQAHIRVAMREGATAQEVLQSLQAVIMPMGALAFRRGLQAWAAETGFQGLEE